MSIHEGDFPFFLRFFAPGFEDEFHRASPGGLNIYETKEELIIEAPVPGVKKDEVTVEAREGILKIDAVHREREEEKKEKETTYQDQLLSEFHYSTTLPKEVEESQAKARLEDGVLKVRLPLKAGAKEKRATVPVEGE